MAEAPPALERNMSGDQAAEEEPAVDLGAYRTDPWDLDEDLVGRQAAARAYGFLVMGKPGSGKATLAAKMAGKLGVVHVGFPQVIADALEAEELRARLEGAKAEHQRLTDKGEKQVELRAEAEEKARIAAEEAEAAAAAAAEAGEEEGGEEEAAEGEGEGEEGEAKEEEAPPPPTPPEMKIETDEQTAVRVARMLELAGGAAGEGEEDVVGVISQLEAEFAALNPPEAYLAAAQALRGGGAVAGKMLSDLLTARVAMPDVVLRGYVLDGVPPGDFDLGVLAQAAAPIPPLSYIIEIRGTDETALAHLKQFRLDPESGLLYSGPDLTPGEHQPLVEAVNPEDPEGPPLTNEDGSVKMVRWEPPEGFEAKLVKRACDQSNLARARIQAEWDGVVKSEAWEALAFKALPHTMLVLDGTLTPDAMLRSLLLQLPFFRYPIVIPPERCFPLDDEAGIEAATLETALAAGSDERTGPFRLSSWGEWCPVALAQQSAVVRGKPALAARYAGRVFLLSSEERLQAFLANPCPFLSKPPAPPSVRVMVVGPHASGKSSVARHLAGRYGARHVDMLGELEGVLSDEGRRGHGKLAEALGAGEQPPPLVLTDVLRDALGLEPRPETPPEAEEGGEEGEEAKGEEAGSQQPTPRDPPPAEEPQEEPEPPVFPALGEDGAWGKAPEGQEGLSFVIEDWPCTAEAVAALRRACCVPTVVLVLGDESEGAALRGNLDKEGAGTRTNREEAEHGVTFPVAAAAAVQLAGLAEAEPLLAEAGCAVVKLSCNTPLEELVEACRARVDPFVYGAPVVEGAGGASEAVVEDPALGEDGRPAYPPETPSLQVMGWVRGFCPVLLKREGVLVPGAKELAARYRGGLYLCSTEEARAAFLHNPSYFATVPARLPEHQMMEGGIPPPRVLMVGADGSMRGRITRDLAEANDLLVLSLDDELPAQRPKPPPPDAPPEEGEEEPPFDPEWTEEECAAMCAALRAKLSSPPYTAKGVVLESSPLADKFTTALLGALLHPQAAFFLTLDDATAVSRLYGARDGPYPRPHRLPFYPFLDMRTQRRDVRTLKALAVEIPNPTPRDEEGRPVEPKPTDEQLREAALAAEQAVQGLISARNQAASASAAAMQEALRAARVSIRSINTTAPYGRQMSAITGALAPYLAFSRSALASALPVTDGKAQALLELGRRGYSKFGMTCPVALRSLGRRQGPASLSGTSFPVVYGPHVYFCHSEASRRRFIADPVSHTLQPESQPRAAQRVVVVGPPKSGRSSLAVLLGREMGAEVLTPQGCVAEVMEEVGLLGEHVKRTLYKGLELDGATLARAVVAACRRRPAWVLDGFPCTAEQAEAMEEADLSVTGCVVLGCGDEACLGRADAQLAEADAEGVWLRPKPGYTVPGDPAADPPTEESEVGPELPVLAGRGAASEELVGWRGQEGGLVSALTASKDILLRVDAEAGRTRASQVVRGKVVEGELGRQAYLESKVLGRPAPMYMQQLWKSREALRGRRGAFSDREQGQGDYCSVCWKRQGDLVLCADSEDLRWMVEYRAKYYVGCSQECCTTLLSECPKYVLGDPPLPKDLPRRLGAEDAAKVGADALEYKGYCPVTYKRGPKEGQPLQSALLKPEAGAPLHVAEYMGRHFRMLSADLLDAFMRRPQEYADLKLPVKLPFDKVPAKVGELPLIGYLEETVVESMQAALVDIGRVRPRFPAAGNKESALVYLSLWLRANNPLNSRGEAERRAARLEGFKEACGLLTRDAEELAGQLEMEGDTQILPSPVLPDSETVKTFHKTSLVEVHDWVRDNSTPVKKRPDELAANPAGAPPGPGGG